jgi:hypothetical protein
MAGQHFAVEDALDDARFNRALWHGLLGESTLYPAVRDGHDWSQDRAQALQAYHQRWRQPLEPPGSAPATP